MSDRAVVQAGIVDAPWLDAAEVEKILANELPHLREARRSGVPMVGSGAVWPVRVEDLLVDDFPIPAYYKRMYALDVGWRNTAVLHGALNPEDDVLYLYSEYKEGELRPELHAMAIKSKGSWIPGVIDPAAQNRSQIDGLRMIDQYRAAGLMIIPANNEVRAGVSEVYQRMTTGRLKIFKTLPKFKAELLGYAYDENGKIIKKEDHLCDSCRYICLNLHVATTPPQSRVFQGGGGARKYF